VKPLRLLVLLVFAVASVQLGLSAHRSHEQVRFYTHVEPDLSVAEIHEVERGFKLASAVVCAGVSIVAAAPWLRRVRRGPRPPGD